MFHAFNRFYEERKTMKFYWHMRYYDKKKRQIQNPAKYVK